MSVTQREIAEQLNLSITTVSRSLQSDPAIAPQTRGAVMQLAASLGYRSRQKNRSQERLGRLVQVGVLVRTNESHSQSDHNLTFGKFLTGMSEVSRPLNISLSLDFVPLSLSDCLHEPKHLPLMIRENIVRGLILVGHYHPDTVAALAKRLPTVRIAHHDPGVDLDCVDHDDMRSMLLLLHHLKDKGHRRIGFVRTASHLSFNRSRTAAFMEATMAMGQEADMSLMLHAPQDSDEAFDAMIQPIRELKQQGVTAWICSNDPAGYALSRALQRVGMSVPEDISLCAFDNKPAPEGLTKLTSIEAPFADMGSIALKLLHEKIEHPQRESFRVMVNTWLVEGQSVACLV
jgi:LacI family transcriptional regulator